MGVVKKGKTIQAKHQNKGEYCMMVGYGLNYPQHTYRVMKLSNNRIITTRDITWLDIVYVYFIKNESLKTIPPEIKVNLHHPSQNLDQTNQNLHT